MNELASASIAVGGGNDVPAGGHEGQEHGGGAIHAAGGDEAVVSSFHCSDFLFTGSRGWITISTVFVGSISAFLVSDEFLCVLECVGGCLDDGCGQRICRGCVVVLGWCEGLVGCQ